MHKFDMCLFLQSLLQELLQQHQEEAERDFVKATGHTEFVEKKGFGKTKEADIGLEELYMHAEPRWKFGLVTHHY